MNKSFRNRMMAVTAAASMSFLLLSGFDSSLTVEEISQKTTEAMSTAGGLNCDVQGIADVSIDVSAQGETQSLPISGSLNYSIQLIADPFVMAVSGNMSGDASAMGMAGGMDIEMYIVSQDDGSGIAYIRMPVGDDTGWHAAAITAEDMESLQGSVQASLSGDPAAATAQLGVDLSSLKELLAGNMQLVPEAVNVNGVDCYEITQTVDGNTLFNIVSGVMNAVPNAGIDSSSLSSFQMLFDGIELNTVSDVAVDTFAPVYASMDLSGSDFSMVGQMFGAMMLGSDSSSQVPDISVNVNALNVSMSYGEVPDEIAVPAEALTAEVEATMSLSDMSAATQVSE